MLEKSKRILIFTTAYRPLVGGSELAIENITRRLPNIFFDILTPRLDRGLAKQSQFGNLTVYRIGWGGKIDKYIFPVLGFLKARRLLKIQGYQIIHGYQASQAAGAAWVMKLFHPWLKFILSLQEGKILDRQNFFIRFSRRLILKKADLITAISTYLADYARGINKKTPIKIVPNGVDLRQFRDDFPAVEELKKKLGVKNSDRVIISVSRLVPKNGLSDLIQALPLVKNNLPDAKLLIIGIGPLEDELKKLVRELGLEDAISFLGLIDNLFLPKYLKVADVFVRPAYSEGLGTAFLEALAAGLPIIGPSVGGIPDFLKDRQTGLFCKVGNPADIALKIIEVLTDSKLRSEIVANGRILIAEKFNWQVIAGEFEKIYNHET